MNRFTLTMEQAAEAGAEHAGGKGWNLGRMARYGLPVPESFVVDAELYRGLVADPHVAETIARLASATALDAASRQTEALLEEVRKALALAPWPEGAAVEIDATLARSGLGEDQVAVRSSATVEDSGAHSFAGIHDSVLAVRGGEEVRKAILTCYQSLWSPRALAYRRHRKLADATVACAVVVCKMVPAQAAGVAFTCDPKNGRRDVIRISAVAGLGDALVSGRVNPVESAVVVVERECSVLEHPQNAPLTEGQLLVLARLCLRVHWAFGDGQDPQDIEWVFDGTGFVLVQARPVTSPGDPRPPALHALPVMYSNANIKDAVPVVLSTMAWSMIQGAIDSQLYLNVVDSGYEMPPGLTTLRRFRGRGYFDLTLMQWIMHDCFGLTPHEISVTMGGQQPELPLPALKDRPLKEKLVCGYHSMRLLLRILRMEREILARQATHRAEVDAIAAQEPSAMTLGEIGISLRKLGHSASTFQQHFMIASTGAGAWLQVLQDSLKPLVPDGGALSLAAALLAGSGEIPSAQQGYAIGEMADVARGEPAARAYLESQPRDPQGWRALSEGSGFRKALEAFLKEYGHRTVYEAEVSNPRWVDDPTYILDQVRIALDHPVNGAPQAAAARARGEEALGRISWFRRPGIRWLVRKAARGAAFREGSKSMLSYSLPSTRRLVLEIGRRMVDAGLLVAREDIFHLSVPEVLTFVIGEWDGRGARALVADRLALRAQWLTELPPDCFTASADGTLTALEPGGPLPAGFQAATTPSSTGPVPAGWFGGLALSSGVASGAARCIRHPDDGHRLEQGEVLVAPSTDPAWTPLFLRASAIVMETGGMLSHGAIVAREYGLPAVSNVTDLWARVPEGRRVTVDGGRGRIAVEPQSPSSEA